MLSQQVLSAASAAERQMYLALTEVEELTQELAQAIDRQDQVSVRLFLSLRQEQINRLTEQKALLQHLCGQLPAESAALLQGILSGTPPSSCPEAEELSRQVERNRILLERVLRADRRSNQRLCGRDSFYSNR